MEWDNKKTLQATCMNCGETGQASQGAQAQASGQAGGPNRVQGLEHNNTGHTTKCCFIPPTKKKGELGLEYGVDTDKQTCGTSTIGIKREGTNVVARSLRHD